MSSEPEHLGGGKYANWYAGPVREDGLTRQRLQIAVPSCVHDFDMREAQALYRFLESHYGWMLGQLEEQEQQPEPASHKAIRAFFSEELAVYPGPDVMRVIHRVLNLINKREEP